MTILDYLYISIIIAIWMLILGTAFVTWQTVMTLRAAREAFARMGKTAIQIGILQSAVKVGALRIAKKLFKQLAGKEVDD